MNLRKNRRPQRRRSALRCQPALAPGVGARTRASGKQGARLLDGDG